MTSWHSYRMMINIGQMLEQKGIEYLFSFNSNRFTTILLHAKKEVLSMFYSTAKPKQETSGLYHRDVHCQEPGLLYT